MRQLAFFFFFVATTTLCARARVHEMEVDQARQVVLIVARYDNITVDDRTIVMNSMDTRTAPALSPATIASPSFARATRPRARMKPFACM